MQKAWFSTDVGAGKHWGIHSLEDRMLTLTNNPLTSPDSLWRAPIDRHFRHRRDHDAESASGSSASVDASLAAQPKSRPRQRNVRTGRMRSGIATLKVTDLYPPQ